MEISLSRYFSLHISPIVETLKKLCLHSDICFSHSAAIITKNKVLSLGYNKSVGYANFLKGRMKVTIHAEVDALLKMRKTKIKGADIVIIRASHCYDGNVFLRNSRPCNHCIDKLLKHGVRKVYYSNEEGNIVCEHLENMEKFHVSSGRKNRRL